LRIAEINERRKFSVGALKVQNFMNVEREVKNKSSFDVEVSVKNLVE